MTHALARIIPLLLSLTLIATAASAGGDIVTHNGIIYKQVSENQLAIVGFVDSQKHVGVYEIMRHVMINRQEYTVVNPSGLKDINGVGQVDSLVVHEFAFDLIRSADLRKFSRLNYLKIKAEALGNHKDYRLIAKHLTGSCPVSLDFFTFPSWVTVRNGVHYTSDLSTLLFTGTLGWPSYSSKFLYLPDGVQRIAPYAIGKTNRTLFLILPPSVQSISPTQIWREDNSKKEKKRLNLTENNKNIYLFLNQCVSTSKPEPRIEPPIDTHDPGYELKLLFAIDPVGEALNQHLASWAYHKPIEWRSTSMFHAKGKVYLNGSPLKLMYYTTREDKNNKKIKWNSPHKNTRTVTQDTTLDKKGHSRYEISPLLSLDMRLLGFIRDGRDTIRTASSFCWSIGDITVSPICARKNQYVEGFDFLLSNDKKTLKWWKNQPDDKSIAHLDIPNVTRCSENFLHDPPTTGSYTFPEQLTQIGPRAISNIKNLRLLIIDHDLALEKSSLSGCTQLRLIKLLNDTPLPKNAISNAFYPDPVPENLKLFIPKEHEAAWKNVKDSLGAPLAFFYDSISLKNKNHKEAAMKVLWKENLLAPRWRDSLTDSIVLPSLALFKVDFLPLPAYDFDSLCLLPNSDIFAYRDTLFATHSLTLLPQCRLVQYPVRFYSSPHGSLSIHLDSTHARLDSGALVGRDAKVKVTATPNIHYRFAHFSVNGQMIWVNPYVKSTRSPLDIRAFFQPIRHAIELAPWNECQWEVLDSAGIPITYWKDGKGGISFDSICENQSYTFRPIADEGRSVEKAFINGKRIHGADTTLTVTKEITLCATTVPKECLVYIPDPDLHGNILLHLRSGATVAPNSYIPWGEMLTIKSNINRKGFKFDSFIVNGVSYEQETVKITADCDTIFIDLKAAPINFVVFVEPDYRFESFVSSSMPMNEDLKAAGYWGVLPDQPITIALQALPGWVVTELELHWEGAGKETFPGARKECNVKANLTVIPKLKQVFYRVTLPKKTKAGEISAYDAHHREINATTKLSYGDSITILPQAGKGYELKTLSINGKIMPPRQTELLVTDNILVAARFDKIDYSKADTLINENDTTLRFSGNFKCDSLNFSTTSALSSITTIAAEACAYNSNLTTAIITGNVATIESRAFYGCPNLRSVTIGPNVRYIGAQAFAGADKLEVIDVLQTNPNLLTIDPAIFLVTRDASSRYIFRVPNESVEAFRNHPKWKHVTVVPQTVEWTFTLESADFLLYVNIYGLGEQQQHLSITQGQNVISIPGGAYVAMASAPAAAQTITRIALGNAATALPCTSRAVDGLTVSVLEYAANKQKETGFSANGYNAMLIRITPNPASTRLTITPIASSPMHFTLYNMQGQAVTKGTIPNTTPVTLPLNNLETGVYILHVDNGKEAQAIRIVKN